MSNPNQAPPPRAAAADVNQRADGVRVKRLTFVSKGLPLAGVNSNVDSLQARPNTDVSTGVDITWHRDERHFRIARYTTGELSSEARVHETRIEFWEPMP